MERAGKFHLLVYVFLVSRYAFLASSDNNSLDFLVVVG